MNQLSTYQPKEIIVNSAALDFNEVAKFTRARLSAELQLLDDNISYCILPFGYFLNGHKRPFKPVSYHSFAHCGFCFILICLRMLRN